MTTERQRIDGFVEDARKDGATDQQIYEKLMSSKNLPNLQGFVGDARKGGASDQDIATHLGLNIQQASKVVDKGQMSTTIGVDGEKIPKGKLKGSRAEGFVIGAVNDIGGGLNQIDQTIRDKVSELSNSLLGTNFDTSRAARVTHETNKVNSEYDAQRIASGRDGFDGARFLGNIAATVAAPSSIGKNILTTAIKGGAIGVGIGATSFAKDSDERIKNTIGGGIGGAVGGVVGKKAGDLVVKGYNAVKNNMRSGTKEIIEQGEKHGVSTSVGDVGRNPIIQKAEVLNEQVPFFGTSSFRAGQQQEAKAAANKVVEKLQGKMSEANYKSLHKIQEAANNGDRNAARIFKIVEDAKDDSSKILQAAAEVRAWREGNLASKLYDEAGDIAKAQGGMVQPSNTLSSLNSRIAQENGSLRPNKELLKELVDIQKRLNSSNVSKDFSNMRLLRSELGDLADSYANGVNPNLPAAKFFGDLRSNVEKDISDYALNSGNNALKSAYKRADSYYKSIMLTRDRATAKAMQSNKPDEIFNQFVKVGKGDRAANFYQNLDPKGQAALRYEMANQALNKATNSSNDVFSPAKFAREFERLQEPYQNIFKGSDKAEMDGFVKLMRHVERAGQYAENPPTGNRLAFGAVTVASLPVATKIAAQAALTKTLFTTPTGRRILLAAKDLPPGSEGLENLLKMAQKLSTTTGSNLSKQNQ
jgi:hypothetical protein